MRTTFRTSLTWQGSMSRCLTTARPLTWSWTWSQVSSSLHRLAWLHTDTSYRLIYQFCLYLQVPFKRHKDTVLWLHTLIQCIYRLKSTLCWSESLTYVCIKTGKTCRRYNAASQCFIHAPCQYRLLCTLCVDLKASRSCLSVRWGVGGQPQPEWPDRAGSRDAVRADPRTLHPHQQRHRSDGNKP